LPGPRRQLIGPVFFPLYIFTLKAGLGVSAVVTAGLALITTAMRGHPDRYLLEAFLAYPGRALMVFAWATLGFAMLDAMQAWVRVRVDWEPRSLPKVAAPSYQIPRMRSLCEAAFGAAAIVWLLLMPRMPFLLIGPAAAIVDYGPIWRMAYVPIVLIALAMLTLSFVNVMRPYRTKGRTYARLAVNGVWLIVLVALVRSGDYFVPAVRIGTAQEGVKVDEVVTIINASFHLGFIAAAVVVVVEIVRELRKLKRATGVPRDPMAARAAR
jgi:hypothetical protein